MLETGVPEKTIQKKLPGRFLVPPSLSLIWQLAGLRFSSRMMLPGLGFYLYLYPYPHPYLATGRP